MAKRRTWQRKADILADDAGAWLNERRGEYQQQKRRIKTSGIIDKVKLTTDEVLDPVLFYVTGLAIYLRQAMSVYDTYADNAWKSAAIGIVTGAGLIAGARLLAYPAGFLHRRAQRQEEADAASWVKTFTLIGVAATQLYRGYDQVQDLFFAPPVPAITIAETESLTERVLNHPYKDTTYEALIAKATDDPQEQANIATIIALEVGNEKDWENTPSATGAKGPGQFTTKTAAEVGLCNKATKSKAACAVWDNRTNPTYALPAISKNLELEQRRIRGCIDEDQTLEDTTLDLITIAAHNGGSEIICEALKHAGDKPTAQDVGEEITPGRIRKIYPAATLAAIQAGYKRRNSHEERSGEEIKATETRKYLSKAEELREEFLEALE